ncbi:MAG: EAL domain-containing protein [Gammaproteobacteria bacterium]|nr:EAL domain-containing protein [Gammaproteobacteria bacterium]
MAFDRRWLFLIYIVVLGLGSVVSAYVYSQGQKVRDEIVLLNESDISRLRMIANLKQAVIAREPILYRYYTDTDQLSYRRDFADNVRRIEQGMKWLTATFPDHPALSTLHENQATLERLATALEQTLAPARVDWDEARRILGDIDTVSRSLNETLEQLSQAVEKQVAFRSQFVSGATEDMFYSVAAVSVIIFIMSLFFGHYAYQHLSDARERRLLTLFPERNPNPVLRLDGNGLMNFANPAAQQLIDMMSADSVENIRLLPDDLPERLTAMRLRNIPLLRFEYRVAKNDFFCTLQYLDDFDTYHVYLQDITARREAERHMEFLAYHDAQTGLPNRRHLDRDANVLLSAQNHQSQVLIALINVDRFRMISQGLGHLVGDRLISALATRLNLALDGLAPELSSTLYRLEGDHFAVLAHLTDIDQSADFGTVLRQSIREPFSIERRSLSVSMSVGIAHFPEHGHDLVQLLKNAESAMRNVSTKGGDDFCIYHADMNANALRQLELSHELRHAITHNELRLCYQPKVNLRTGMITGVEALVRWEHSKRGTISPAEFIPLAEETGSITVIGDWILRTACQQCLHWRQQGLPTMTMAVNISARQFTRDLPDRIALILSESGLSPDLLELEITEGIAMTGITAIDIMSRLRALDVKLAIDDFGTGFSSLAYLKRFPIQTLKIDQSFVQQMESNASDRAIVRAIVELGHQLDLEVVAEGVEELSHLQLLRQYSCDTMQGYLLSRPVSADDLAALALTGQPFELSSQTLPEKNHSSV